MGTAERQETPRTGVTATAEAERGPEAPDHDIPVNIRADTPATEAEQQTEAGQRKAPPTEAGQAEPERAEAGRTESGQTEAEWAEAEEPPYYRPLWIEEPARRRRLPDPVRTSAVRAVIIIAVTLIQAMVAFLCTLAGSWLAFPMVLSSVASTVVATWGALDVWVTRQVWNQRNGVVSVPSSSARAQIGRAHV